jgi:hypothetical protein
VVLVRAMKYEIEIFTMMSHSLINLILNLCKVWLKFLQLTAIFISALQERSMCVEGQWFLLTRISVGLNRILRNNIKIKLQQYNKISTI